MSIDVTKDLESLSALKTMLSSREGAIFTLFGELTKYEHSPIQEAAAAGASAKVNLSGTAKASWKTGNGIAFSLTPQASCSISLANTSTVFAVAMSIESPQTTNIVEGPAANTVYVNIDLDFDIQGSVSGSGTFSGVGVAGKASGSKSATLSFCQPVDATLPTLDALKLAFSGLVFPLDPACARAMQPGSLAKVSFDGAIDCKLEVTYGLGNHKVSAPSVANVQQSLHNVMQITPPTLNINAGAKGSVTYRHADHFSLIVDKTNAASSMLYLVRSSENDVGESVGVTVGVTSTDASVSLDQTALQTTVQHVTGSGSIASAVVSAASQPLNSLQTSLNAKLKSWISDATGQAGLTVSLGQQSGHTALFTFQVNLATADLAEKSWAGLVGGSVVEALQLQGFTLEAGSGVSDSLKRSSTIQFQFFNLFNFSSTSDYFSNAYTEFGADGAIRVFRDLGQEQQNKTKHALTKYRIHFVATATEDALSNVTHANIDLYVELSQSAGAKYAAVLANAIGMLPRAAAVQAAQGAMVSYVAKHPQGTLNLINIIHSSAYRKLTCTPYDGSKPGPLPQEQDQNNWNVFQAATGALMPDLKPAVANLSFDLWMDFNRACIDQIGSQAVPDRRNPGAWGGSDANAFLSQHGFPPPTPVTYFLLAGAGFMNLCDDLQTLAQLTPQADSEVRWNNLLNFLTSVVTNDVFIDYANPTAGALLFQCSVSGAQVATKADLATDSSSLTCTLTLS